MPKLIYEERPGEIRTAWLVDGAPKALLFRRAHWPAAGDVHLGRVLGHAPDASGAFVLLSAEGLTGFLKRRGRMRLPGEGERLCVTVDAFDPLARDKAARVQPGIHLCGRYVNLVRPGAGIDFSDCGPIAQEAVATAVRDRLASLAERAGIRLKAAAAHVPSAAVVAEAQRLWAQVTAIEAQAADARVGRLYRPPGLLAALAEGPPGPVALSLDMVGAPSPALVRIVEARPDVALAPKDARLSFDAAGLADWLETVAGGVLALPGGGGLRLAPAPTGMVVDVDAGAHPARGDRTHLWRRLGEEAARHLAALAAALRLQGLVLVDLPVRARDGETRAYLAKRWRAAFSAVGLGRDLDGPNRHGIVSIALRRRDTPILAFLDMAGLPERLRQEARLFAALRSLGRAVVAGSVGATAVDLTLPTPLAALAEQLGLPSAWEQALNLPLALRPQ